MFFETCAPGGGWSPLPNASGVNCPPGWRFPTPIDHLSMLKFLVNEEQYAASTERYAFNWYPTLTNDAWRFFNISLGPEGTVIVNNTTSPTPGAGATSLDYLRPVDANGQYPVRCVKDIE